MSGNLSEETANGPCTGGWCRGDLWRNGATLADWSNYHHYLKGESYNTVFDFSSVIKKAVTLEDVINKQINNDKFEDSYLVACKSKSPAGTSKGHCRTSIKKLLKQSLTALFNSASAVPFEYSAAEITTQTESDFNDAVGGGSNGTGITYINFRAKAYTDLNSRTCPLT